MVIMSELPLMHMGLRVILTDGGRFQPVRIHRKSANQRKASYHNRVQKKWLKRFGSRWVETQKRGEVFMLGRHSMIVRKDDWPEFMKAIPNG